MEFSEESEWIRQNPDKVCKAVSGLQDDYGEAMKVCVDVTRSLVECLQLMEGERFPVPSTDFGATVKCEIAHDVEKLARLFSDYYEY